MMIDQKSLTDLCVCVIVCMCVCVIIFLLTCSAENILKGKCCAHIQVNTFFSVPTRIHFHALILKKKTKNNSLLILRIRRLRDTDGVLFWSTLDNTWGLAVPTTKHDTN